MIENLQFNKDHLKALENYVNEEDFDNNVEITEDNVLSFLEFDNINLLPDLQNLLLFTVKSDFTKSILLKCRPSRSLPKKRCESFYGEGNCEMLDDYVWAKKCPFGYRSVGLSSCVPQCPGGFAEMEDDPFYCQKISDIQRSYEFYDVKNPPLKFMFFRELRSPMCPEHFSIIGIDFCKRKCPFGWGDLGPVCQKPLVVRRKNEIFAFDFGIDDYLESDDVTHNAQELANFQSLT